MQDNIIPIDIAYCFIDNYAETFQSELANEKSFIAFLWDLNIVYTITDLKLFSLEETIIAVSLLHPNKKDIDFLRTSNASTNALLSFLRALTLLINHFTQHGFFPFCWHTGSIILIPKSGHNDKSKTSSYRPIYLLCPVCMKNLSIS